MGEEKTFVGSVADLVKQRDEPADSGDREVNIFLITGQSIGRKFRLRAGQILFAGRSSSTDIFLDENLVSRRHAKFAWMNDEVKVQDLGSTNGTFVNGRKVISASLRSGDKVQIGQTLMKVYFSDDPTADLSAIYALTDAFRERAEPATQSPRKKTFQGNLVLMALPELLQMMAANRSTGILELNRENVVGRIYCKEGRLQYALLGPVECEKAVFRLLGWKDADFEFRPETFDAAKFPRQVSMSLETVLMEGFRQIDELEKLGPEIPPRRIKLKLISTDPAILNPLPPAVKTVLRSIVRYQSVGEILDRTPLFDLDIVKILVVLRKKKLIGVNA
jgi:Domain of unknown function (DUF4388)/FHA domain